MESFSGVMFLVANIILVSVRMVLQTGGSIQPQAASIVHVLTHFRDIISQHMIEQLMHIPVRLILVITLVFRIQQ